MPFHALTVSDTTSYFAGHTKRKALPIFLDNTELLSQLGRDPLTETTVKECESFICKLHSTPEASTTDEARVTLFQKGIKPELLPQTSNAARHHIMITHLQAMIWLKAIELKPMILDSTECGWNIADNTLQPVLLTSPPSLNHALTWSAVLAQLGVPTNGVDAANQTCHAQVHVNVWHNASVLMICRFHEQALNALVYAVMIDYLLESKLKEDAVYIYMAECSNFRQ